MSDPSSLRQHCAQELAGLPDGARQCSALLGLDGFVDQIIHVVDQRHRPDHFERLRTIRQFSERVAQAAGKSTNIELVPVQTKLGGNGPILAYALATLGVRVTYTGNLGYPDLHAVFRPLAERAKVYSIGEPGHTDALEFDDGKILLGKMAGLNEITWENIQARMGRQKFLDRLRTSDLAGFLNWTMTPYLSELWEALLEELDRAPSPRRAPLFFDLADPQKRPARDIRRALELISKFSRHFEVILGMNEKEACETARALGAEPGNGSREGLADLAQRTRAALNISAVTIHPTTYALTVTGEGTHFADGPKIPRPVLTTGGGDHYNAGYCLGRLLELGGACSVLLGVATSGFYVGTGSSPSMGDLVQMLRRWPA